MTRSQPLQIDAMWQLERIRRATAKKPTGDTTLADGVGTVHPLSDSEHAAAGRLVARYATDADDLELLLEALGILDTTWAPVVAEKQCAKCDQVKPATEFYRFRRNRDGLQSYCKPCHQEVNSACTRRRLGRPDPVLPERCGVCDRPITADPHKPGPVSRYCSPACQRDGYVQARRARRGTARAEAAAAATDHGRVREAS